jgi:quercetin dioxygenase-like cupin family protein
MLAEALALSWDEQEFSEARPGIFGATVQTDQLTVTVYRYEPGCFCEPHEHADDQVTCLIEGGTLDFVVDGRAVPLTPGRLAVIPATSSAPRRSRRTATAW